MNRAKKHKAPLYSEAQATKWLSWLAKNMQRHDQTVFLIEGLQPSWLARKNYIRLHLWISICASILLCGLSGSLFGGLLYSPIGGLLGGLWLGGMDVIRHYTLRLLIYLRSYGPWNYAKFLDYAVDELHFMQRVGGGYIFIHRMLLEHFAAMEEEVSGKAKPEEVPVAEGP